MPGVSSNAGLAGHIRVRVQERQHALRGVVELIDPRAVISSKMNARWLVYPKYPVRRYEFVGALFTINIEN